MFNFDEPRYEKVVSDALALRPQIEAAVDKVCEQGYSNIFFIGCGGTWAHTLPMKYWVETTTADVDVHCEIAAELFVSSSGFQLRQRFFSHVARKGFRFGKGVPLSLFGFAS